MLSFLGITAGFLFLVLYLSGKNSFPKPLSPEEEAPLIEKMLAGDKKARSVLIEKNLRLVAHIVKKYYAAEVDNDDLVSIGTIGLIKGIDSYKGGKNTRLSTYVSRCIENEILMYIRKNSNRKREVSIDEPLNVDWDGNELLLSDVLGTDEDVVYKSIEESEERIIVQKAIKKLSKREQIIINLRFGLNGEEEKTQKEVADLLGISQSYISRLEKKIIKRLKKEIETKI